MKNFEAPTMSSVPGFTASHDSEWLEFSHWWSHVPGSGFVEPGGTGYPPPATGLLATTFVPTRLHAADADPALASAPSTASATKTFFTISPPLLIGQGRVAHRRSVCLLGFQPAQHETDKPPLLGRHLRARRERGQTRDADLAPPPADENGVDDEACRLPLQGDDPSELRDIPGHARERNPPEGDDACTRRAHARRQLVALAREDTGRHHLPTPAQAHHPRGAQDLHLAVERPADRSRGEAALGHPGQHEVGLLGMVVPAPRRRREIGLDRASRPDGRSEIRTANERRVRRRHVGTDKRDLLTARAGARRRDKAGDRGRRRGHGRGAPDVGHAVQRTLCTGTDELVVVPVPSCPEEL